MTELVVLASAEGEPIGTAPKAEVHTLIPRCTLPFLPG